MTLEFCIIEIFNILTSSSDVFVSSITNTIGFSVSIYKGYYGGLKYELKENHKLMLN